MSEQTDAESRQAVGAAVPSDATTVIKVPAPSDPVESMETVTCPECGRATAIAVHRRDSASFCPSCDFPLFWAPSRVVLDAEGRAGDDSLRRLPGTAGRATVASLTCPHCAEQNQVSASLCLRCGRSLHPEPVYVAPAPVPVPEPVVVEPEPERRSWGWLWIVALILAIILVGVIVWVGSD